MFLYCSGGGRSVKFVVVHLLLVKGVGTREIHRRMSKHPGMLSDGIILLHDNARPHTVNLARDKLRRFGWETLQHPPYSPDISSCDYHIFGDLKKDSWTSVSLGRGSARVGKVVDPSATYLFLQDWN